MWLGAPRSQHTQVCSPGAAEEAGTGRGNQELGRGLGTKPPLCGPQHPRETWQVPVPLPSDKQSCHSPSPHCVCCGCSLLVLGHPLCPGESTENPKSQIFVYFHTSDYSSSNLRLERGFYFLLLVSVLFKMLPVQAQEELPCAQPDTRTHSRAHWHKALPKHLGEHTACGNNPAQLSSPHLSPKETLFAMVMTSVSITSH